MKSEWRERGVAGSEQFLSLKTRLIDMSFPNSENKSLPVFSKALKLSSLKTNNNKMKFMDVFNSQKSSEKEKINKLVLLSKFGEANLFQG